MIHFKQLYGYSIGCTLIFLTAIVLSFDPLMGQDNKENWQPAPPMPEKFDWIQLTSDEWLKGEFVAMYDDKLEFDSDELGLFELDWADIKAVRSTQTMQVLFRGELIVTGKLLVEGKIVQILGQQVQQFDRSQIVSITGGEPKEINYWSGKVTVGINFREGNSDQLESNFRAKFKRRTPSNRVVFDYLANISRTNDEETANNNRLNGKWDRFITDNFFITPLFGELFHDPFLNIALRGTIGGGVGYELIDSPVTDWQFAGGFAYQSTEFEEVVASTSDSENTPALVLQTIFERELTNAIDFDFDYGVQITNEASGTFNHHMVTGFETELTQMLDFDITFVWDRVQNPRADEEGTVPEKDDYRLNLGLGLDF